jgi:16S rRNA (adenine1518-N6/adenine1519-N6)-dimethyltransferase
MPPRPPHPRRINPAKPRKRLGQHFLMDEDVLERIIRESRITSSDVVLEIGAGAGALTERLARVARHVVAVELDETLCSHLRRRFAGTPSVAVVCAGVLEHTPRALLAEGSTAPPYVVVANIPYYITAPILRTFLESPDRPRRLTLMVQKEVAESIVAPPGQMSLLGVSVQFYGEARLLFTVPPAAFQPPPKVASAVVQIDVRDHPAVDVPDVEAFFDVVRAGFATPRKQLHNALAGRLWLPPDSASDLLRSAGIDPTRRAQTLSLAEWAAVDRAVRAVRAAARDASATAPIGEREP